MSEIICFPLRDKAPTDAALPRECYGRDWHRDYEAWEALPVLDMERKVPRVERVIGYICLAPIVYGAIYVLVQLALLAMARLG